MSQTPGFGYADDADRYRLDGRIATGGMGEVWRATDTLLGREVAVKVLKSEYADDAAFRVRFESEAQHAASLHHPNIATVYDVGESMARDGSRTRRPFLVMELVDGQPLSALLRPGEPMAPVAAQQLLAQVADGLGAAHDAGIVHRDVKPANLLVTPDRTIKITDFGIARAVAGVGLTSTGEVMGTPQYLSPEQAQGQTATSASDVYSLGVVAFECLAGRRPYVADTAVATALAHLREPIPDLPASVPADLAAVVRRALAKDPAERFADGRELAAALRSPATAAVAAPVAAAAQTQVIPGATAPAPAPAPPEDEDEKRGWVWPVIGVIALVVIAVLLFMLLNRNGDDAEPGDDQTSASPTRSSSAPTTPSEPTTSSTIDQTIRIDESTYVARPVGEVQRELGNLGLRVETVRLDNPGDQIEGDVDGVNPTGALQPGDTVTVSFWGPLPPSTPSSPATSQAPGSPASSASSPSSPSSALSSTPSDSTSPSS